MNIRTLFTGAMLALTTLTSAAAARPKAPQNDNVVTHTNKIDQQHQISTGMTRVEDMAGNVKTITVRKMGKTAEEYLLAEYTLNAQGTYDMRATDGAPQAVNASHPRHDVRQTGLSLQQMLQDADATVNSPSIKLSPSVSAPTL